MKCKEILLEENKLILYKDEEGSAYCCAFSPLGDTAVTRVHSERVYDGWWAVEAEREFEIYREREMRLLESDFDKVIKQLANWEE